MEAVAPINIVYTAHNLPQSKHLNQPQAQLFLNFHILKSSLNTVSCKLIK